MYSTMVQCALVLIWSAMVTRKDSIFVFKLIFMMIT